MRGKERIECRVEGKIRLYDNKSSIQNNDHEGIQIRCTDGFELRDRDPAVRINDNTLWVNGDDRDDGQVSLATLRVKRFFHSEQGVTATNDDGRVREADLLISGSDCEAHRLQGECRFEGGNPGPIPTPVPSIIPIRR
jgi:hypothetical protein